MGERERERESEVNWALSFYIEIFGRIDRVGWYIYCAPFGKLVDF